MSIELDLPAGDNSDRAARDIEKKHQRLPHPLLHHDGGRSLGDLGQSAIKIEKETVGGRVAQSRQNNHGQYWESFWDGRLKARSAEAVLSIQMVGIFIYPAVINHG